MVGDFKNRTEAGRQLASAVLRLGLVEPLVLALPRGGVPVGAEVARALRAPLDVLIVRKIGAPGQPELAVAAMAEGDRDTVTVDERTSQATEGDHAYIERQVRAQRGEIDRRCSTYRIGRARLDVAGRTVVVVDDGVATGTTVRAALKALQRLAPAKIVLAVPIAAGDTVYELSQLVDDIVCLSQPGDFRSVGTYYADFDQVDDREVIALLDAAAARSEHEHGAPRSGPPTPIEPAAGESASKTKGSWRRG